MQARKHRLGSRLRRAAPGVATLAALAVAGAATGGWLDTPRDAALWLRDFALRDNFHAVVPGELYRSAEMAHERLAATIRRQGIATVVDLRNGPPDPDAGGRTEPDVVADAGATWVHVPMLSSKLPSKQRLLQLIDVLETAERPILVHCSSGALRTGVAAAIWLMAAEQQSPAVADDQLRIRYGYTRLESDLRRWQHGIDPLVTLLDAYADAYRQNPVSFRAWVEAGTDVVNVAGVRQFTPPAQSPGAGERRG